MELIQIGQQKSAKSYAQMFAGASQQVCVLLCLCQRRLHRPLQKWLDEGMHASAEEMARTVER